MMKSHLIDRLQQSIAEDGDSVISVIDAIDIVGGKRAVVEYVARERLVRNIVRAKRQLKAPMSADFFRDIWPQALSLIAPSMDVWQSIESAPKNGTFVLLFGGEHNETEGPNPPCVVGFWLDVVGGDSGWRYAFWDDGWGSGVDNPTHWMHLPEQPEV